LSKSQNNNRNNAKVTVKKSTLMWDDESDSNVKTAIRNNSNKITTNK